MSSPKRTTRVARIGAAIRSLFGVSGAGLLVLLSTHGKALLDALAGIPVLLERWSAPSALGMWSILAGLILPIGLDFTLDRWLPAWRNAHARMAAIEAVTAVSAVAVVFALLPTLPGLMLGIGCGMFAPPIARLIRAGSAFVRRQVEGAVE